MRNTANLQCFYLSNIFVGPYNSVPDDSSHMTEYASSDWFEVWLIPLCNFTIQIVTQLHNAGTVAEAQWRSGEIRVVNGLINAVLPDRVSCTCLFAVFVYSCFLFFYFFTPDHFTLSLRKLSSHPCTQNPLVCHCVKLWAPINKSIQNDAWIDAWI